MDYQEALAYIHAVHWQGHKPGLDRIRTLLAALGDPHKQLRFVPGGAVHVPLHQPLQ